MGGVVYCSGRTRPWATARSKMQERKRIRAVRGYEGSTLTLDDLWRVFSCYGEVASVIIEPGRGATVTYRDQCSFPELEPSAELELVCGEQRVLVSRHQVWPLEGAEWPQQHHYHFPPPPTTARPRPRSARTTTPPSWTWGSPRPRPSTASACPCPLPPPWPWARWTAS